MNRKNGGRKRYLFVVNYRRQSYKGNFNGVISFDGDGKEHSNDD
jgi:hypothetical protein